MIFLVFIAPQPEVYSRDGLLSLRSRAAVLDRQQCLLITHLQGLRRRGCRGGQHRRRPLQPANVVTSSVGVPAVNRNQLIDAGFSTRHTTTASLSVSQTPTSIPVLLQSDATSQSHQLLLPTDCCLTRSTLRVPSPNVLPSSSLSSLLLQSSFDGGADVTDEPPALSLPVTTNTLLPADYHPLSSQQPSSSLLDEEDQLSDRDSDSWFDVRSPPSLDASFESAVSEQSEFDVPSSLCSSNLTDRFRFTSFLYSYCYRFPTFSV